MSKPRILVARKIFPEVIERLSQHFEVESNQDDVLWTDAELLERLRSTQQQRDLLDRACASYIERQAAEKAASGLISLAVASAWANEQRLLISTAMGQIANAQSALHGQEEVTLP